MVLVYFEISFADVYWSKKAFVFIKLSVFVEIILSESAESDIPIAQCRPKAGCGFWMPSAENCSPSGIAEGWKKSLSVSSFVHADENALTPTTQPG